MYLSAIKGKSTEYHGDFKPIDGMVFYNDLSRRCVRPEFERADFVYSEPAWLNGYYKFNEIAGNSDCESWKEYVTNIDRLVHALGKPSFVTGGVSHGKYLTGWDRREIRLAHDNVEINATSNTRIYLYFWNYDLDFCPDTVMDLLRELKSRGFKCPLDPSCGFGEHLLTFDDFVACDINTDSLAWLSDQVRSRNE